MARGGPGVAKRTWLSDEDERLLELVRMLGVGNWTAISIELSGGRTSKQCRERWHNHLDPSVKKGPWTAEEDAILLAAHEDLGNAWSLISERIEGRTDMAVKNRFQTFVRSAQRKGSDVIQSTAMEEGEAASSMQKKKRHGGRRVRRADPAPTSSSSSSSSSSEDEDEGEGDATTLPLPPPIATARDPSSVALGANLKWDSSGNDDVSRGFSPFLHFAPSPATGAGDGDESLIDPTPPAASSGAASPFAAYLLTLGQSQSGASPAIAAFSPSMLSPHALSPALSPALHALGMMMPPPPPRAAAAPPNAKAVAPTLMAAPPMAPPRESKTTTAAFADTTTLLLPPPPPAVAVGASPSASPPAEAVRRFAEVLGQQAAEVAAATPSPSPRTPYVPMRVDTAAAPPPPTTAAPASPSRKRARDETTTAPSVTRFGGGVPALPSPLRGAPPPLHAAARVEDQPAQRPADARRPSLLLHAAAQIHVGGQPQPLQQLLPSASSSTEPRSSKIAKLTMTTIMMPVVASGGAPADMCRMVPPPAPVPACAVHATVVACA